VPIIIILATLAFSIPDITYAKTISPYHWKIIFAYLSVAAIIILIFLWFVYRERKHKEYIGNNILDKNEKDRSIKIKNDELMTADKEAQKKTISIYFTISFIIIGISILLLAIKVNIDHPDNFLFYFTSKIAYMVGSSIWIFFISEAIWRFILKKRKDFRLFCFSIIFFCAVLMKILWK
jgi:hypothetical protein